MSYTHARDWSRAACSMMSVVTGSGRERERGSCTRSSGPAQRCSLFCSAIRCVSTARRIAPYALHRL
eukprot:3932763-Rhodomonas_salina.3